MHNKKLLKIINKYSHLIFNRPWRSKIREKIKFSVCTFLFRPLAANLQARKYFPIIFRGYFTTGNFFPKGMSRSVSEIWPMATLIRSGIGVFFQDQKYFYPNKYYRRKYLNTYACWQTNKISIISFWGVY